ncbi:MAG: lmo0937 family membrane protein [Gemmatimonadota bacterium]
MSSPLRPVALCSILLLMVWATGFFVFHPAGGWIHLVLLLALLAIIREFLAGFHTAA